MSENGISDLRGHPVYLGAFVSQMQRLCQKVVIWKPKLKSQQEIKYLLESMIYYVKNCDVRNLVLLFRDEQKKGDGSGKNWNWLLANTSVQAFNTGFIQRTPKQHSNLANSLGLLCSLSERNLYANECNIMALYFVLLYKAKGQCVNFPSINEKARLALGKKFLLGDAYIVFDQNCTNLDDFPKAVTTSQMAVSPPSLCSAEDVKDAEAIAKCLQLYKTAASEYKRASAEVQEKQKELEEAEKKLHQWSRLKEAQEIFLKTTAESKKHSVAVREMASTIQEKVDIFQDTSVDEILKAIKDKILPAYIRCENGDEDEDDPDVSDSDVDPTQLNDEVVSEVSAGIEKNSNQVKRKSPSSVGDAPLKSPKQTKID